VLIENGVEPQHLVAAGFGEFQPIDGSNTEDAKTVMLEGRHGRT
jgi:chemotaxis protein MotB